MGRWGGGGGVSLLDFLENDSVGLDCHTVEMLEFLITWEGAHFTGLLTS